jgi:hypothetical protein
MQISTGTEDKGEEVENAALIVFINEQPYSLQEAWDIGNAILAYVNQAELSQPYVRAVLEQSRGRRSR